MAGRVPAIHVLISRTQGVDALHKAGHDEKSRRMRLVGSFIHQAVEFAFV